MTQEVKQSNANSLDNAKLVKTLSLSLISIPCALLCVIGSFIGIALSIIALVRGDKEQHIYLVENQDPSTWSDSPVLLKAMVYATIGFVINALIVAFVIDYVISEL